MMNHKDINENKIQFEDFIVSSQANKIGDAIEVSMGGPWTAKRFVISEKLRHPTDATKIVLIAKAVVSYLGFELDPVAGTVKKCGAIVAHYVHDEVCGLHYVGKNLESTTEVCAVEESVEAALKQFAAM